MATKEELFAAVRLIKEHCKKAKCYTDKCPLLIICGHIWTDTDNDSYPCEWPDPEEGGGEDG